MHPFDQSLLGAYHVAELRTQARQAAAARTLSRREGRVLDRFLRSLRHR